MTQQERKKAAAVWRRIALAFFNIMTRGVSDDTAVPVAYGLCSPAFTLLGFDNDADDTPVARFNPGVSCYAYFWHGGGYGMRVADVATVEAAEQRMYAALFIAAMVESGETFSVENDGAYAVLS